MIGTKKKICISFLVLVCVSTTFAIVVCPSHELAKVHSAPDLYNAGGATSCRRHALERIALGSILSFLVSEPATAFDNRISNEYENRPKQRGSKPNDLGIATRSTLDGYDEYTGLKPCKPAPNCFCSTMSIDEDPDHSIPAWIWPESKFGNSVKLAFEELQDVLAAYEPGQNGVDGGGFKIQEYDPEKGYIYVQFESLKNGYIDDFEVAYVLTGRDGESAVQVRSSSRLGYLDYGVNAKRLNYIAEQLRRKGWDAEGVNFQTHKLYAYENQIS